MDKGIINELTWIDSAYATTSYISEWFPASIYQSFTYQIKVVNVPGTYGIRFSDDKSTILYTKSDRFMDSIMSTLTARSRGKFVQFFLSDIGITRSATVAPPFNIVSSGYYHKLEVNDSNIVPELSFQGDSGSAATTSGWFQCDGISSLRTSAWCDSASFDIDLEFSLDGDNISNTISNSSAGAPICNNVQVCNRYCRLVYTTPLATNYWYISTFFFDKSGIEVLENLGSGAELLDESVLGIRSLTSSDASITITQNATEIDLVKVPGASETLQATLAAGNITGGTDISISAGDSIVSAASDPVNIASGGNIVATAADGSGLGAAPTITLNAGHNTTTGEGGGINLRAGDGGVSGGVTLGGVVTIQSGDARGVDGDGGDVSVTCGRKTGTGNEGTFMINVAGVNNVWPVSSGASGNKLVTDGLGALSWSGGADTLENVLIAGNTTGSNDIILSHTYGIITPQGIGGLPGSTLQLTAGNGGVSGGKGGNIRLATGFPQSGVEEGGDVVLDFASGIGGGRTGALVTNATDTLSVLSGGVLNLQAADTYQTQLTSGGGDGGGPPSNGGDLVISSGLGTGGGTDGDIKISTHGTTYTFPTADGISGHQLTTDGSGNLSFTSGSGGVSVAALSSDVQVTGSPAYTIGIGKDATLGASSLCINGGGTPLTGVQSTAFGHDAGVLSSGGNCTYIGRRAGYNFGASVSNTLVGASAGENSAGNKLTLVGYGAGDSVGAQSCMFGELAGRGAGNNNCSFGMHSSLDSTGGNNAAFGFESGGGTTSTHTTCIGFQAGKAGRGNDVVGLGALAGVDMDPGSICIGKSCCGVGTALQDSVQIGRNCGVAGAIGRLAFGNSMEAAAAVSGSKSAPTNLIPLEWNGTLYKLPALGSGATDLLTGSETLAQTLAIGSVTGGNNIEISTGDQITTETSGDDLSIIVLSDPVTGGDLILNAGNSDGTPGQAYLQGGDSASTGGIANVRGGFSTGASATSGAVVITSGSCDGTNTSSGDVTIGTAIPAGTGTAGNLKLNVGSVVYTMPPTDGTSGQVLQTNASGVLSWATPATTSPVLPMGRAYMARPSGVPYTVSIISSATYYQIDFNNSYTIDWDTNKTSGASNWFSNNSGGDNYERLTYLGTTTQWIMFRMELGAYVSSNSQTLRVRFAKNGTLITNSNATWEPENGSINTVVLSCMIEMATNDYIDTWVSNQTSTADIQIMRYNLIAMGSIAA